jgi:DNA ligase-1
MEKDLFKIDVMGNLRWFNLVAEPVADGAVLISRKGLLHGVIQEDRELIYPKNVGRTNETTPIKQAELELISKANKLKDKGYLEIKDWASMGEENIHLFCFEHKGKDASGNVAPMLAKKDVSKASFPCFVQPKLNGLRCMVEHVYNGSLQFRSRRGKIFNSLGHILDGLPSLPHGWILDGELFKMGIPLQSINSLVKRKQPMTEELEYHIFDIYTEEDYSFEKRYKLLKEWSLELRGNIRIVKTEIVYSKAKMDYWFNEYLDMGYEGLMWRDRFGTYQPGIRSGYLIKYKPTDDEEFEIVDVEEATGRDEGTAVFVLITKEGLHFNSRPKGTRALRRQYLLKANRIIGKMAKVIFDEKSKDGIPLRSRVECIREKWDM